MTQHFCLRLLNPRFIGLSLKNRLSFDRFETGLVFTRAYTDLPNNCAVNLIIFWVKNNYKTLLGPTRLLISEIYPSKPDFHLHKSFLHGLIKTYTFINV